MKLGFPILSPLRVPLKQLAVFAIWESEEAVDEFLSTHKLGKVLSEGWHVRLEFIRRWGRVRELEVLGEEKEEQDPLAPVVAVTLARMKLTQVPRFIRWGKPVETLVRDHPGVTLATAAVRFPRTVSTFSVWKSQNDMLDMVHGRGAITNPTRHIDAMEERDRKDFHWEFTTLRFRPLSEHGQWDGRNGFVSGLDSSL